jgi:Leucine-rich repeat (LRR) protein
MERIPDTNPLTELPSALFVKFSRLETLDLSSCNSLEALPEEIGELSHLKLLDLHLKSLVCLPFSLGKVTTLEKIAFIRCYDLTTEGIGPLQHLTGLTSLSFCSCNKEK